MNRLHLALIFYAVSLNVLSSLAGNPFIINTTQELLVNGGQQGNQKHPFVATLSNGEIIMAFAGPDDKGLGIYLTKPYSSTTSLVQVNTDTSRDQTTPLIIVLEGTFIVLWFSENQKGICGRKFTNSLERIGKEFKLNQKNIAQSGNEEIKLSTALDQSKTGFMVVWIDSISDDIFGAYFDLNGNPITAEFQINKPGGGTPRVISVGEGLFCVSWIGSDKLNNKGGVSFFKMIDKLGKSDGIRAAEAPASRIFVDLKDYQYNTGVVALSGEKILCGLNGGRFGPRPQSLAAQLVHHNGTRIGQLRNYTSNIDRFGKVSNAVAFTVENQTFAIIVWGASTTRDETYLEIQGVVVDDNGDMIGSPFLITTDYIDYKFPHLSVRNGPSIKSVEIVFTFQNNNDSDSDIFSTIYTFNLKNYEKYLPVQRNPTFLYGFRDEIEFNGSLGTSIYRPWLAAQPNGNIAIVYDNKPGTAPLSNGAGSNTATDPSSSRVVGALFSNESPIGVLTTIQVNTNTKNDQNSPMVISLADNMMAACWASNGEGNGWDIVCAIFDNIWNRIGEEFVANINVVGDQGNPNLDCKLSYCNNRFDIASLNEGHAFIVAFSAGTENDLDIYAVIYNVTNTGAHLFKSNFLVNSNTDETQASPRVVGLSSGGFIITWSTTWGDARKGWDVYGKVFDSSFNPITGDIRINKYARKVQYSSSLIALEDDTIVAMWLDRDRGLLVTQIMDALLYRIGSENSIPIAMQGVTPWYVLPRGVHLGANYFAITFAQGTEGDGNGSGCFLAFFDPEGAMIGNVMQANQKSKGDQKSCMVLKIPNENRLIVAWEDSDLYPTKNSVRMSQFAYDLAKMRTYGQR